MNEHNLDTTVNVFSQHVEASRSFARVRSVSQNPTSQKGTYVDDLVKKEIGRALPGKQAEIARMIQRDKGREYLIKYKEDGQIRFAFIVYENGRLRDLRKYDAVIRKEVQLPGYRGIDVYA